LLAKAPAWFIEFEKLERIHEGSEKMFRHFMATYRFQHRQRDARASALGDF
jgi:hypothetical protein